MRLVTPTDMDGNPNPFYDDLTNDDVPDGRVDEREGYIQAAYEEADQTLALVRSLMEGENVFVTSDHGFAPQWYAVNVSKVLVDIGLQEREQSDNCRKAANDPGTSIPGDTLAKECRAGGTSQIYINLANRDPAGSGTPPANEPQVASRNYEAVRNQIIDAFEDLDDPNIPVSSRSYKRSSRRSSCATFRERTLSIRTGAATSLSSSVRPTRRTRRPPVSWWRRRSSSASTSTCPTGTRTWRRIRRRRRGS